MEPVNKKLELKRLCFVAFLLALVSFFIASDDRYFQKFLYFNIALAVFLAVQIVMAFIKLLRKR